MIKGRLLAILVFCSGCCFAQSTLPPAFEIIANKSVDSIPINYWQLLVDSAGKWTINDVTSGPASNLFTEKKPGKQGYGFVGVRDYWIRMKLKNSTQDTIETVFRNRPNVDRYDLYIIRGSGNMEHHVSGSFVAWRNRDGYKGRVAVPVMISPGEEITIYKKLYIQRVTFHDDLWIGFSTFDHFVRELYLQEPWYESDIRNWLIAGILIFGFFFNFFFFWIVREKVYLFLALVLLTEGLWYFNANRSILREAPYFRVYYDIIVSHAVFFTMVTQFVRSFLKTRIYQPSWDRVLVTLNILMVITSLGSMLFARDIIPYSSKAFIRGIPDFFFTLLMTCLLLSFLVFNKQRPKVPRLAVIAALPVFLLWSLGYGIRTLYVFLGDQYGIPMPASIGWYSDREIVIEMFCIAWFAILFTWILLQRYALLRKQYTQQELERERERMELINQQKVVLEEQVEQRTAELKRTIEDLKKTQAQLIHSEKMASLGELTAGIAHEIQNPLNFVNNFSEVNSELIAEMKEQLANGNVNEAIGIAADIDENEQKIIFHGKRADAIVKGMLQHSRSSSAHKEPTDINALADEYLRLAYHGLRAKDKSFNAIMKTDYDENVGTVNVITQDIGRVILNLITNAFYAVSDKARQQENSKYEPTVTVQTKKLDDKVKVSISDNGNGVPNNVREKIFQPFFTTKPAGQGTGLGLSLSYDIIKAHGGDLELETTEGKGATFIITLPA
jgi:two-component system NtrC family sensor kinase